MVLNWRRNLPAIATVVLLVLVAHSAATLTWRLVAQETTLSAKPATPVGSGKTGSMMRDNIDRLRQQALFGTKLNSQANTVIDAPETQLNLILRGLLAGDTEQTSRAIISNGNEENSYSVGQTIAAGITVHAILTDRVIISRRGTLETVRLPRESGIVGGQAPNRKENYRDITSTSTTNRATEARAANSVAALAEIVRPIPVSRDGKQIGFRVYPGRARKKFVELGLQAGDIVTAINNISLDDPTIGIQAFENLGKESSVTVSLIRDGQEQQLVLQTGN